MARMRKKPNPRTLTTRFPEPLNTVFINAISEDASDIHLDTLSGGVFVRYRVDGIIHEKQFLSLEMGQRLLNQVKVAANFKIERAFSPMESQIEMHVEGVKRDLRVTLIPTGEEMAVHMRFLSAPFKELDIGSLGFDEDDQDKISSVVRSPHGLILVSGRTGAGKTTTLYSLVSLLDLRTSVAVSIEDPVEFNLPGLRQLEVGEDRGLTMSQGLRIFLRMDPDVILVGEIRDRESAIATAQAALAGRLVIATIHAKDPASTVEALVHLSVPRYILGNMLSMIIGQSLARKLCSSCATPRPLKPIEKELFVKEGLETPEKIWQPVGCEQCNSYGYFGLIGVFETVKVDEAIGEVISTGESLSKLRKQFRSSGIKSALADGLLKVALGKTSMEEIARIFLPYINTPRSESPKL